MKPHRTDGVSLTFGLIFLGIVIVWLFNVAIDLVVGAVPLVGDAADVFWKSNSKNMTLLERHAAEQRPASAADWLFVSGIIAAILAVALVPLLVLYWVGSLLFHKS